MGNKRILYIRGYSKSISEDEYKKLIARYKRPGTVRADKKDGKSS
jgi:hypothetical protein